MFSVIALNDNAGIGFYIEGPDGELWDVKDEPETAEILAAILNLGLATEPGIC